MEAAERAKLEDEIRTKQDEVMRIQTEVELKDQETRRLQVNNFKFNRRNLYAVQFVIFTHLSVPGGWLLFCIKMCCMICSELES